MAEIISVANAAELYAALSSAQGGDRIELAGGDYGSLSITGVTFPSDVTIVSADPDDPAIVRELDVDNSVHLVFDGIVFSGSGSYSDLQRVHTVDGSSYITIRNSVFAGDLDADGYGTGKGLNIQSSDHLVIENNEFFHWMKAIAVGSSTDIILRANDVHSVNNDGFNFTAVNGLLIEDNWIHDFLTTPGRGHNDMIQIWNPDPDNPAQNIIIRGNFLDAGTGERVQTIFMGNGKAANDPTNLDLYYRNILIEDNVIYNAHTHGISIGETIGLTIINNTILRDKWVEGTTYHAPMIRLYGTSQDVLVEANILHKDFGGTQFVVQDSDPNGENYYGDLFVNALAEGATLADLRAVSGGLIETLGVGAEMTRSDIDITLEAGPAASM